MMGPHEARSSSRVGSSSRSLTLLTILKAFLGGPQDFRDPQGAHPDRKKSDPVVEVCDAVGKPLFAALAVDPDRQTNRPMRMTGMVSKKEPLPEGCQQNETEEQNGEHLGGPSFTARSARTGVSSMIPMTLKVPPIQDPQALIKRAAPPRPLRVI